MAEEKSDALFAIQIVAVFLLVFCVAGYFLVRQYFTNNQNQSQMQDSNQLQNNYGV